MLKSKIKSIVIPNIIPWPSEIMNFKISTDQKQNIKMYNFLIPETFSSFSSLWNDAVVDSKGSVWVTILDRSGVTISTKSPAIEVVKVVFVMDSKYHGHVKNTKKVF